MNINTNVGQIQSMASSRDFIEARRLAILYIQGNLEKFIEKHHNAFTVTSYVENYVQNFDGDFIYIITISVLFDEPLKNSEPFGFKLK